MICCGTFCNRIRAWLHDWGGKDPGRILCRRASGLISTTDSEPSAGRRCWVVGGCLRSEQHKASFRPNLVEILHGLPEKLQKKMHFHLLLLWDRVWHTEMNTEWCQFSSQVALNHCKKMRWVIRRAAVKPQNKNYVENWMKILYLCFFHVFIWGRPQSQHLTFSSAAIFHLSSQVEAPVDDWVTFFMYAMINSPSFHCTVALCLYPNFSTSAKHVNAFPTFWLFF